MTSRKPRQAGDQKEGACPSASPEPVSEDGSASFADDTQSEDGSRHDDSGVPDDEDVDDEKTADDDEVEWEEIHACPLTVRFTQEKVHPFFYRRGPIVNVVPQIRIALPSQGFDSSCSWVPGDPGDEDEVYELLPPFGPISCLRKGDELWSLDNRRLYALQLAAMEQWPTRCRVRLLFSDRLPRRKLKTTWRKFQTSNEGRAVNICARFQQFDTWSWFDRAVEIEWYTFSQRLGTVLNVFEMMPVVGALLFRTGLTGYRSRVPFIVGFILSFGIDFLRQKVTIFERRISEMHVKAVMDGELRCLHPCKHRSEAPDAATFSAQQLAAIMGTVLILLLPYIYGIALDKLRTSLFSCWLGVACVLFVQLLLIIKSKRAAEIEYSGTNAMLSPKHRA